MTTMTYAERIEEAELDALNAAGNDGADLLDEIPVEAPAGDPTPAQVQLMAKLIEELAELDRTAWEQALDYTRRMAGRWTPGREGNASRWIDRLIAKLADLRAARHQGEAPALPEVADGRYAIEYGGEIRCYHLETGKQDKWAGFRFLSRRSSDDLFPIKNREVKAEILALIAANPEEAEIRYALTVRECRRCHRALTDTKNPYFNVGLGPTCGGE